ncbi:MEKHLA domain-containing protein [Synechococcus sp. UW179B]|jgi:hypothetical protein|uniref:MEKHLA domain-containing protein n=1 Tax=Synechococcus sp. UW179B TaxID=2575516 RepID=UPI000E0F81A9|nr:MEKHLA domain-containing protein [Synechococcus sp. UW179B]
MTGMIPSTSAPWLRPETQALSQRLLISYQRAFAQHLLVCDQDVQFQRTAAQELFASPMAVLAHDHRADPLLTYANSTALRLWGHRWQTMVGMPSRLTAEESARRERASALQQAHQRAGFRGYCGIRINYEGRRFMIQNAQIWPLWDDNNDVCGQAAAFSSWWWL